MLLVPAFFVWGFIAGGRVLFKDMDSPDAQRRVM